ncbi:hypothetical protein LTR84_004908 [Exophiala bonariae]|uniref:D-lactate dehydrogenase (cytochrome) n=1 Tax=Exophiala bonariae TaxID=1690606 RepID=A0AAV9NP68_9EURO|nr:hypothetical protein LTR84_004908 [Exophiala bonariae]
MKRNFVALPQRLAKSPTYGNLLRRASPPQRRNKTTGAQLLKSWPSDYRRFLFIGAATTISLFAGFTITRETRLAHAEQPLEVESTSAKTSTCSLSSMPTIIYDKSAENLNNAVAEFLNLLGPQRVDLNLGARISHSSTEWSPAPRGELDRFDIIVSPSTTEEVSAITKICSRRRIPMTAFSGGTSLEGTLAATQGGVCIDFKLMNKIIAIRKNDLDVTVQPGVGYIDLNQRLAEQGLFFPPDPGPGAQIGGMIAQGCSGTNAFRYGTMKDWVLGLTLVLADGSIVKTRGRPRKSSAGYDLTRLIVGSEGTLAFVTEANLKLTSKPQNERVALAAFPSTSKAVETVVKVVQSDMPIAALELLDGTSMRAVNQGGYCDKEYPEVPTLFLKFAGHDKAAVDQQIKSVQEFARQSGCQAFEFSNTSEEADAIWMARKTLLWSMLTLKNDPSDIFLSADTAVPISQMGTAMDAVKQKITESGFVGACLGHVGDGNFHTAVICPPEHKHQARQIITWAQRLAIDMDGTVTGEHGIGLEFRDAMVEEIGENGVDMMRQIKLALDPLCLLNPDKLFRLKIDNSGEQ